MLPYTKGAKAVIHGLKALEDEGETIWADRALMTLADLSPIESVLARVLRSIWNDSSRRQLRQGTSGRPGTEHLRPGSMSGFTLLVLQGEAEQAAVAVGDQEIGERHIAKALTTRLGADLRAQGIDANRLVAEVTAMERGPLDERIKKALELEERKVQKVADKLADEVNQRSLQARSQATMYGHGPGSTPLWAEMIRFELERLERIVQAAADARREACRMVPELGSPGHLASWRARLQGMVDSEFATLHVRIAGLVGGAQYENDVRRFIVDRSEWSSRLSKIAGAIEREAEMISREVSLGALEPAKPAVTVNIQDSTVATLNLGTVMGNIQSIVATLQQGQPEVAIALQKLIEAVAADETLGDRRRDAIESLGQIGEEATRPEDRRRTGLVKTLLVGVGTLLAVSANATQIWQTLGPIIARHFGVPWP